MTDPRTEIRRRIVRRLNTDEWMERHFGIAAHAEDVADAVMELFPEGVEVEQVVPFRGAAVHTRLVLRTAPEPIEETQP